MAAVNLVNPTTATTATVAATIPVASGGNPTSVLAYSTGTSVKIEKATIVNNDSATRNVSLGVGPASGVSGVGNSRWLLNAFPLGAGDSLPMCDYLEGLWLGDLDCVFGFVSSGALVTIVFSVTLFS